MYSTSVRGSACTHTEELRGYTLSDMILCMNEECDCEDVKLMDIGFTGGING
jgi:hypothetical protein